MRNQTRKHRPWRALCVTALLGMLLVPGVSWTQDGGADAGTDAGTTDAGSGDAGTTDGGGDAGAVDAGETCVSDDTWALGSAGCDPFQTGCSLDDNSPRGWWYDTGFDQCRQGCQLCDAAVIDTTPGLWATQEECGTICDARAPEPPRNTGNGCALF